MKEERKVRGVERFEGERVRRRGEDMSLFYR
jgi:hypothetical protein